MAERLTQKIFDNNGKQQDIYEWSSSSSLKRNKKLGMLEDIMEEYNIKTISQLKARLSGEDKSHKSAIGYMKDRDTWKKACELACDVLRDINYKIYNEDRIDFENTFYQQAKKEGESK